MNPPGTATPIKPKAYKSDIKPVWCPGCWDFAVLNAYTKALAWLALPREDVAMITGIGCSSRIAAYTSVYGFHGVHGRALALASGLKAARPDLTVLVAGGDGDGLSIGGNHFIHACRRNMDLTAGASFIARGFTGDPNGLAQMLVEAIEHPGFSFIQVLSPWPTFRPEQTQWKHQVRPFEGGPTGDPILAAQRIQADDGMSFGVIYKNDYPVFQPGGSRDGTLADIEAEFGS
ncbi:MAG: thiamine pyrophosphate-dependent enzyme [Xanthomonadales bacterium]|nr:thiamine pyrophosphate-dependent enzyme [Xanthomonadales bacterium]